MARIKTLLILAANPQNTPPLRLAQEVRDIEESLTRSKHREEFKIKQGGAVRFKDFRRALLEDEPHIVHFCGHGQIDGILLEDESGNAMLVPPEALTDLFKQFKWKIECVVLNACYSEPQANAIHQHIQYVIGMKSAIEDHIALEFAIGFYDALGAGRTYEEAFEFGRNAIQAYHLAESEIPILKAQKDIPHAQTEQSFTKEGRIQFEINDLRDQWNAISEVISNLAREKIRATETETIRELEQNIDNAEKSRQDIERKLEDLEQQLEDLQALQKDSRRSMSELDEWKSIYRETQSLLKELVIPHEFLLTYRYNPDINTFNLAAENWIKSCLPMLDDLKERIEDVEYAKSFIIESFLGYSTKKITKKLGKVDFAADEFDRLYVQFNELKEILREVVHVADQRMMRLAECPQQNRGENYG